MNVLSCFDGMSCGQIALERAGIKVDNYYASEIDKYAIQVAKKNYQNTIHIGDVTKVSTSDLPKIDLLIGGSPCQGFSFAGKQLNFNDERSKLFFEYVRLLKQSKPKYFLLENVKMKKEHQDVISDMLGVEPVEICSSLVSGGLRKRLYWTNIQFDKIEDKGINLVDILDESECDFHIKPSVNKNIVRDIEAIKTSTKTLFQMKCDSGFQDNKIGILKAPTLRAGNSFTLARTKDGKVRKLNVSEWERLQTVPERFTEGVSNTQRYKMLGNGWTVDVIAHIFKGLK